MKTSLQAGASANARSIFVPLAILVLTLAPIRVSAITGGVHDGAGHPNAGALVINFAEGLFVVCSGTLIDDKVFLTAGHCVAFIQSEIESGDIAPTDVFVSFDSENALDPAHLIPVSQWFTHPNFPGKDNVRTAIDVGVLILEHAPGLTPATLPAAGYLDQLKKQGLLNPRGQKFVNVGYGTLFEFPPPTILDPDNARWVSESFYRSLSGNFLYVSQNLPSGSAGTGFGDSGGPRFWNDGRREILVAITSRGDPRLVAHDAAQRIDLPVILDWLHEVILAY